MRTVLIAMCVVLLGLTFAPSTQALRPMAVAARTPSAGSAIPVHAGDNLQAKLNAAKPGDVFLLDAGATWDAIIIPNIASASPANPITVRTATPDGLFPDAYTRVGPAHAALMPKINVKEDASAAGITVYPDVHDWIFMGIEVGRPKPSVRFHFGMIVIGESWSGMQPISHAPANIVFDRMYIHGTPGDETKRGINILSGKNITIKNSWIGEIHDSASGDSTALWYLAGPGPYLLDNSFVSSSGINWLTGGQLTYSGTQPENFTITRNTFAKDLRWKSDDPSYVAPASGNRYGTKNLFEFKSGAYALIEGNIFEYCWAQRSDQSGSVMLFTNWQTDTPVGNVNKMPQNWVHDITVRNNIFRHTNKVFGYTGNSGYVAPPVNISHHIYIQNNLIYDVGPARWAIPIDAKNYVDTGGAILQVGNGGNVIEFTHNTVFQDMAPSTTHGQGWFYANVSGTPIMKVKYRDNIVGFGNAGASVVGVSTYQGLANLVSQGGLFDHNVVVGMSGNPFGHTPATWGQGLGGGLDFYATQFWPSPDTWDTVGFVNRTNYSDFHLKATSPYHNKASDGTDVGANIDMLMAAQKAKSVVSLPSSALVPATPLALSPPLLQPVSAPLRAPPAAPAAPASPTSAPNIPTAQPWSPITYTTNNDNSGGGAIQVTVPGNMYLQLGSASKDTGEPRHAGMETYYDLKNDPSMQYDLAGPYLGLYQHAFGYTGGKTPYYEYMPSVGTVTVLEANAIRVKMKYSWIPRKYGHTDYGASQDVTGEEIFVVYAPDKIYETLTLTNVSGGPITIGGGGVAMQLVLTNSWTKWIGAPDAIFPDYGRSPSPTTFIYQDPKIPPSNMPAQYILHANQPGYTTKYDGTRVTLPQNFLMMVKEDTPGLYYSYRGAFLGGMRSKTETVDWFNMASGATFIRHLASHIGDNGITSRAVANTYLAEYYGLIAPTMAIGRLTTGTHITNGFDYQDGAYSMLSGASGMDFVTHQAQHYPVFQVAGWQTAVPGTIKINGATKTLNADYSAVKLDANTLLLQYRSVVGDGTHFEILNNSN